MMINREGNRFVASFDAAMLLRKVIENTQNAELVFESVEERTNNSAMLVEGDAESVFNSSVGMGIPALSR